MPISRAKKASIVSSLKEKISASPTVVFVGFKTFSVADATIVRKTLKQTGVDLTVAKKTLIKLALGAGAPDLPGAVALAYLSDDKADGDALAPAKGIYEFTKKLKDGLKILGGIFEGKFVDAQTMTTFAAIPSREVLYNQLANLLASPMRRLAVVLDQLRRSRGEVGAPTEASGITQ